jgi:hypothetical protein
MASVHLFFSREEGKNHKNTEIVFLCEVDHSHGWKNRSMEEQKGKLRDERKHV